MADEQNDKQRNALKERVDKCSDTINRAMVSLLAFSFFCLLTTFGAAERSMLAPEPSIKIPFGETQVSFVAFLVVAPILLVILVMYLHVFYGHWLTLDAERRAQDLPDTYPALFNLKERIARFLTAFTFYWPVPIVLITITWRAAARFEWGLPIAFITGLVIASLIYLRIVRRRPGRGRIVHAISLGLIGAFAVIGPIAVGIKVLQDPEQQERWERPVNLFRVDLKGAWLPGARLHRAWLDDANLQGADLTGANLNGARLFGANLDGASLMDATLRSARLGRASLRNADLLGADLSGASLSDANLSGAKLLYVTLRGTNLRGANLSGATFGTWFAELPTWKGMSASVDLASTDLEGADLRGTDLSSAQQLTCEQIRSAQMDVTTKLPKTLHCPASQTMPRNKR